MAAITARDSFDENAENVAAVTKDNFSLEAYLAYDYPGWEMVEYETEKAAMKAVQEGNVDCFVSNSGKASGYLGNSKLHSIFLSKAANVSFGIQKGEPLLLSIINKTLMSVPAEKFSGAVVSYNSALRKITMAEFIRDNFLTVSIVAGSSFLLILCVILVFLRKSRRAEAESKESASRALELNHKLEEKQKELKVALAEAQSANKAKTTFLNNMSHDIRTPINGIMGMLAILEKSGDDPGQTKECMDKISRSSQLLLSLVNDVLDMAKLESGEVILSDEAVNLDQVCGEVMSTLVFQAEAAGLTVTAEHDDYRERRSGAAPCI